MTPPSFNLAVIASAVANIALTGLAVALVVIVVRLRRRLRDWAEAAIDQTNELGDAMADNDRLQIENDRLHKDNGRLAADLQDLRDENVSLLRNMVTGEAS